jgi:hypothetical protein
MQHAKHAGFEAKLPMHHMKCVPQGKNRQGQVNKKPNWLNQEMTSRNQEKEQTNPDNDNNWQKRKTRCVQIQNGKYKTKNEKCK